MLPLNLPQYEFRIQRVAETQMIYDPIRNKYVHLTPEEWVRQHFAQYLIQECGYPKSLIVIEMAFMFRGMSRRADIVVHDRSGKPVLVCECKSPDIEITQSTFDQIARYNSVLNAKYLVVTNGRFHYCCEIDRENQTYRFLDDLPHYEAL